MANDYAAALTEERLQGIVRRIVEVADPVRIVLFGSAVRGDMTRHSDVDLLVVVETPVNHHRLMGDIYRSLRGIGLPIDVVLFTREEVESHKDKPYYVIHPALREGRVVYDREEGSESTNHSQGRLPEEAVSLSEEKAARMVPLPQEKVAKVVQSIVEVADPLTVVLFGAAAGEGLTRHRDAHFLIVVEPGADRFELTRAIWRKLRGIEMPLDLLVCTTEEVEKQKHKPYFVIHRALREGKVLYERSAA